MRTERLQKLLGTTAPAIALLVVLCLAYTVPYLANDVDDAYINYRYARSLARGEGYTFNPGERVEGFTSPLWVTLAAAPILLGADDPHRSMQLLGIAFACALVVLLFVFSRSLFAGESAVWAFVAPLWFLSRPNLGFWATSGLETVLYAFLITLGLFLWYRDGIGARFGACMGLAAFTRPEAAAVFGLLVLVAPELRSRRPAALRSLVASGAGFAAVLGPWLLFRLLYYGEVLPNTYFAKRMPLDQAFGTGLLYVGEYLGASAWVPLLAAGLAALRPRPPFRQIAVVWLLALALILWTGADWMPRHRFLTHLLGFEALLVAGGLRALADLLQARSPRLAAALPALLLVPWVGYQATASWSLVKNVNRSRPVLHDRCRSLGDAIRERGMGRIALVDAGKIAYYADVPTLDLVGLTNAYIAHSPGSHVSKRYDPRYVLEQKPDVIVLRTIGPGRPEPSGRGRRFEPSALFPVEARLYLHPAFQRDYVHHQTISMAEPPRPHSAYYQVFLRRRRPAGS